MKNRLTIAIQKSGRLSDQSKDLIRKSGINFSTKGDKLLAKSNNLPIDILFVRDDDIPSLVSNGDADLAIVGENVLVEKTLYKKNNTFKKVSPWMKNYTSRQIGSKIYREDTGLALAAKAFLWRKGKRIGKKNYFIINNDPYTGLDIHDSNDLKLADLVMKFLKKEKLNKDRVVG